MRDVVVPHVGRRVLRRVNLRRSAEDAIAQEIAQLGFDVWAMIEGWRYFLLVSRGLDASCELRRASLGWVRNWVELRRPKSAARQKEVGCRLAEEDLSIEN